MASVAVSAALRLAFSWRVAAIGTRTSLVVGTVLNLVNQWYALFYDWRAIHWLPFALNYAVPYCVATYGAVSMARAGTEPSGRDGPPG